MEPLNTSEIEKFILAVRNAENSHSKELRIDIKNAKNLAFTLGLVMSRLHGDLEKLITDQENNQTIEINLDQGGTWG